MAKFQIVSDFKPTGDQPQAIKKLVEGLSKNAKHQVLLGVTGSGKTFTMANVIAKVQRPTLIISHNKTLAAQLYQEFRDFFPDNAVCYFVSYYDYYQPEAYVPQTDTYIEKETDVNEEIDKLRLSATTALMTRNDVIVVASVSCIYNLGSPAEYGRSIIPLEVGQTWARPSLLRSFTQLQYNRNETELVRGSFRIRGENIDLYTSYMDYPIRLEFSDDKLKSIKLIDPLNFTLKHSLEKTVIYPAKHYVASPGLIDQALGQIEQDLIIREKELKTADKEMFAYRIRQKTMYDIEMVKELGYCNGIENYSRYFDGRQPGEPPYTLVDYFPNGFLTIIDESHMTVPQIRGMYNGDRARKETLINFGFRLPSALDNRPLRFEEFERKVGQVIYTSATPAPYEISRALESAKLAHSLQLTASSNKQSAPINPDSIGIKSGSAVNGIVEQLIRPTGILDPQIIIRPTAGQITDLMDQIKKRVDKNERVLVTTLTKRLAEELTDYLKERGVKVQYLHSEVLTLDRSDILDSLRKGEYDVLVGINLLREGLDLPEVSLVAILDADKEGFLRSEISLIQTMGRAARHTEGIVIMYADGMTGSMQAAIDEIGRRRQIQADYNRQHHITPQSIAKPIREKLIDRQQKEDQQIVLDEVVRMSVKRAQEGTLLADDRAKLVKFLKRQMKEAAQNLEFEKAAMLRDQIKELSI